jgi:hypothetical protein
MLPLSRAIELPRESAQSAATAGTEYACGERAARIAGDDTAHGCAAPRQSVTIGFRPIDDGPAVLIQMVLIQNAESSRRIPR